VATAVAIDRASAWRTSASYEVRKSKANLCKLIASLAASELTEQAKRAKVMPALWEYAKALTVERGRAVHMTDAETEELMSYVAERAVIAIERLDLGALPGQQATYLDQVLRHAMADGMRSMDELGRKARKMRKSFEQSLEARTNSKRRSLSNQEREELLDSVVGKKANTVVRMLISNGMTPSQAIAAISHDEAIDDPTESIAAKLAREKIFAAIASHPDHVVREYLLRVAADMPARKPRDFNRRLGATLPALLTSLLFDEVSVNHPALTGGACGKVPQAQVDQGAQLKGGVGAEQKRFR